MLKENILGYASAVQREILADLSADPRIERSFFLTGGTALSVFYLGHRVSEDLDLFTLEAEDIPDIGFWIIRNWPGQSAALRQSPGYLAVEIKGVRVDLALDPLSERISREKFAFEGGRGVAVDTIDNIASNKLATLVSRNEPKDFIDFYFIRRLRPEMELSAIYESARKKEAIFDDPPTAAFQLEEGFKHWREAERKRREEGGDAGLTGAAVTGPAVVPRMLKPLDEDDLLKFYEDLSAWLYGMR